MKRILVIDDDVELCSLLEEYFLSDGFGFVCAHTGSGGLGILADEACDIVILDVMLPGKDGLEVLREIRNVSAIPVIMLTAKGDHVDRVVGLEIGADDYICKPFNMRELSARVRAILRRTDGFGCASPAMISVADIEMDRKSRSVKVGGRGVVLTNAEFRLLEVLLSGAGRVASPDLLSREALGRDHSTFDRSLSVHISRLRHKLGPYPCGSDRIKTLRGEGFMYVFPEDGADGGSLQ